MAAVTLAGTFLFILAFAVVPKLVRAQVRGRTAAIGLGADPSGVPSDAGEGLRKITIDGEITAKVIEASLQDEGLDVRLYSHSGEGVGGLAAMYFLLYRTHDEPRVLQAVADLER